MNACTVLALILYRNMTAGRFLTDLEVSMIAEVFGNRTNAERIALENGERDRRERWLTRLADADRRARRA